MIECVFVYSTEKLQASGLQKYPKMDFKGYIDVDFKVALKKRLKITV